MSAKRAAQSRFPSETTLIRLTNLRGLSLLGQAGCSENRARSFRSYFPWTIHYSINETNLLGWTVDFRIQVAPD